MALSKKTKRILEDGLSNKIAAKEIADAIDANTISIGGLIRPSTPELFQMFFDISLLTPRPIWWNGTDWVDAAGTPV